MKKQIRKYQFAGNPCGEGTKWDAKLNKCVPMTPQDYMWGDGSNTVVPKPSGIDNPIAVSTTGTEPAKNQPRGATTDSTGKVLPGTIHPIKRDENGNIVVTTDDRTDKTGKKIPYEQAIGDAIDKGFTLDPDGKYRKKEITKDPNNLEYSGFFKGLNAIADITQFFAGNINDAKVKRAEKEKLMRASYPKAQINPYEGGLNNVPIYTKAGGNVSARKARQILHDGTIHGKPITEQQRKYFGAIASGYIKEHGGEMPKYQVAGQNPPIYTDDPNDPRLKAYNDSTHNNIKGISDKKKYLKYISAPYGKNNPTQYDPSYIQEKTVNGVTTGVLLPSEVIGNADGTNQIRIGNGVTSFKTLHGAYDVSTDDVRANIKKGYKTFPKPKQPIIYQKSELHPSVKHVDPIHEQPKLLNLYRNIINRATANVDAPPIQDRPYRVEYMGEDGEMTHTYFPSAKEGEAFMKELQSRGMGISGNAPGGSVEGYYERPPKQQTGGWLDEYEEVPKYQTAGRDRGYGCKGKSCTKTGEGIRKKGVRFGAEDEGVDADNNGQLYLSNDKINWNELMNYNSDNLDKKELKQYNKQIDTYLKNLQSQFPGLTRDQLLVAGADSNRINKVMFNPLTNQSDVPVWDKQQIPFDREWFNFYRSMMGQPNRVTIPQIIQFQSQQPGGLPAYKQRTEGNYGRTKAAYGGIPKYKKNEEYELSEEEIKKLIKKGYKVQYI